MTNTSSKNRATAGSQLGRLDVGLAEAGAALHRAVDGRLPALDLGEQRLLGRLLERRPSSAAPLRSSPRTASAAYSRPMLRTRLNTVGELPERAPTARLAAARRGSLADRRPALPERLVRDRQHRAHVPPIGAARLEDELQPFDEECARSPRTLARRRRPGRYRPTACRTQILERDSHASVRSSASPSSRIRMTPCAWRRSPNGSRDPVGRSPARNSPTSVSSLSASDTAAHVSRAGTERGGRRRRVGFDGHRQVLVVDRLPDRLGLAAPRARRCRPSCPAAR